MGGLKVGVVGLGHLGSFGKLKQSGGHLGSKLPGLHMNCVVVSGGGHRMSFGLRIQFGGHLGSILVGVQTNCVVGL